MAYSRISLLVDAAGLIEKVISAKRWGVSDITVTVESAEAGIGRLNYGT